MSATATSTMKSPHHSKSQSRSSRPSTTPRGYFAPVSVGQNAPPPIPSSVRSPQTDPRTSSPNYFGFVVGDQTIQPDSNPGIHITSNLARSVAPTPRHSSVETNPQFEAFRKQSEQHRFTLSRNISGLAKQSAADSSLSPGTKRPLPTPSSRGSEDVFKGGHRGPEANPFFDAPQQESPRPLSPKHGHSVADHRDARLSLPPSEIRLPPVNVSRSQLRSDTLPPSGGNASPSLSSAGEVAKLLKTFKDNILVLDLRVYPQYAKSRICDALNLCIPTTLLKRPSFTVQRLAETFSSTRDREVFAKWQEAKYIIVYDANSTQAKEAITPLNVLKKFATEGWEGTGLVIKGGFLSFSKAEPGLVDNGPATSGKGASTQPLSISAPAQDILPVAGGCAMPATKSAANPFFGNIRQNMDLLDGVGQVPIKRPSSMTEETERALPFWLKKASIPKDEGKAVSDKFLAIEKSEQKRMQQALSAQVQYGTPDQEAPRQIQIAGIEKGAKNRYNNIFPYDHSRVRLKDVSDGGCDYVNASHVKTTYSNRNYIATQAPIPATFNDFWRVVWEQDIRVIVMLTAESEGGQVKSHSYWNPGEYGPLKLKKLSERQTSLEFKDLNTKAAGLRRPSIGQRRSTNPHTPGEKQAAVEVKSPTSETPSVAVRHFTLSHSMHPFQPMREITQIQYSQWPDFGAPASPTAILGLIELVNKHVRGSASPSSAVGPSDAAAEGERPIMVHCSAGCGRTGTFCTIDSVIDMLKRQRSARAEAEEDGMDVDSQDDWVKRDDIDLIAKAVDDFRHQRLSMVQNLRQFALCYESVMQWAVAQGPDGIKVTKSNARRSYQG